MNLLTQCPGCKGPFKNIIFSQTSCEDGCKNNCSLKYFQCYNINNKLFDYFSFEVENFHAKVFLNDKYRAENKIYIYHLKANSSTSLAFIIPIFEIDWDKLKYYNERWKKLVIFS